MTLHWTPPAQENGILTGYVLQYQERTSTYNCRYDIGSGIYFFYQYLPYTYHLQGHDGWWSRFTCCTLLVSVYALT